MILLDKTIFKGIFEITTNILQNNFFYDDETIHDFQRTFTQVITNEYCIFEANADIEFKRALRYDLANRMHFTSFFLSEILHNIFVHRFNFSEEELNHFENILPKFVGVYNAKQQSYEGTNY